MLKLGMFTSGAIEIRKFLYECDLCFERNKFYANIEMPTEWMRHINRHLQKQFCVPFE